MAILSIIAIVLSLVTITPPKTASAAPQTCDTEFFASNDIVTYDPCAEACSADGDDSVSIEDSKETAESVFKFLISTPFSTNGGKPLNAVQAAGFLGNMQAESGVDAKTIQSGAKYDEGRAKNPGVGGYAFGLVQWDGGRRVQLIEFADKKGTKWDDLETQLNFLKKELEGSEQAIIKDSTFRTTSDPAEAAVRIRAVFERAGIPHDENRQKYAKAFFKQFKDLAPGVVTYGSGGRCSPGGSGNGDIVATAIMLSYPSRKPNGFTTAKPEYQKALEETGVNKLGDKCSMGGYSCDAFVATVMRYSGLDKDFLCCGADRQQTYMVSHPDKYKNIGHITNTSQMKPGDIMWRSGHIKIYLGDGRQADASHCQRTASISDQTYFDGSYYAFRYIGSGAASTDTPTPSPTPQAPPKAP